MKNMTSFLVLTADMTFTRKMLIVRHVSENLCYSNGKKSLMVAIIFGDGHSI